MMRKHGSKGGSMGGSKGGGGIVPGAKVTSGYPHTGSGVKKPTLKTKGGKTRRVSHGGYDGATK